MATSQSEQIDRLERIIRQQNVSGLANDVSTWYDHNPDLQKLIIQLIPYMSSVDSTIQRDLVSLMQQIHLTQPDSFLSILNLENADQRVFCQYLHDSVVHNGYEENRPFCASLQNECHQNYLYCQPSGVVVLKITLQSDILLPLFQSVDTVKMVFQCCLTGMHYSGEKFGPIYQQMFLQSFRQLCVYNQSSVFECLEEVQAPTQSEAMKEAALKFLPLLQNEVDHAIFRPYLHQQYCTTFSLPNCRSALKILPLLIQLDVSVFIAHWGSRLNIFLEQYYEMHAGISVVCEVGLFLVQLAAINPQLQFFFPQEWRDIQAISYNANCSNKQSYLACPTICCSYYITMKDKFILLPRYQRKYISFLERTFSRKITKLIPIAQIPMELWGLSDAFRQIAASYDPDKLKQIYEQFNFEAYTPFFQQSFKYILPPVFPSANQPQKLQLLTPILQACDAYPPLRCLNIPTLYTPSLTKHSDRYSIDTAHCSVYPLQLILAMLKCKLLDFSAESFLIQSRSSTCGFCQCGSCVQCGLNRMQIQHVHNRTVDVGQMLEMNGIPDLAVRQYVQSSKAFLPDFLKELSVLLGHNSFVLADLPSFAYRLSHITMTLRSRIESQFVYLRQYHFLFFNAHCSLNMYRHKRITNRDLPCTCVDTFNHQCVCVCDECISFFTVVMQGLNDSDHCKTLLNQYLTAINDDKYRLDENNVNVFRDKYTNVLTIRSLVGNCIASNLFTSLSLARMLNSQVSRLREEIITYETEFRLSTNGMELPPIIRLSVSSMFEFLPVHYVEPQVDNQYPELPARVTCVALMRPNTYSLESVSNDQQIIIHNYSHIVESAVKKIDEIHTQLYLGISKKTRFAHTILSSLFNNSVNLSAFCCNGTLDCTNAGSIPHSRMSVNEIQMVRKWRVWRDSVFYIMKEKAQQHDPELQWSHIDQFAIHPSKYVHGTSQKLIVTEEDALSAPIILPKISQGLIKAYSSDKPGSGHTTPLATTAEPVVDHGGPVKKHKKNRKSSAKLDETLLQEEHNHHIRASQNESKGSPREEYNDEMYSSSADNIFEPPKIHHIKSYLADAISKINIMPQAKTMRKILHSLPVNKVCRTLHKYKVVRRELNEKDALELSLQREHQIAEEEDKMTNSVPNSLNTSTMDTDLVNQLNEFKEHIPTDNIILHPKPINNAFSNTSHSSLEDPLLCTADGTEDSRYVASHLKTSVKTKLLRKRSVDVTHRKNKWQQDKELRKRLRAVKKQAVNKEDGSRRRCKSKLVKLHEILDSPAYTPQDQSLTNSAINSVLCGATENDSRNLSPQCAAVFGGPVLQLTYSNEDEINFLTQNVSEQLLSDSTATTTVQSNHNNPSNNSSGIKKKKPFQENCCILLSRRLRAIRELQNVTRNAGETWCCVISILEHSVANYSIPSGRAMLLQLLQNNVHPLLARRMARAIYSCIDTLLGDPVMDKRAFVILVNILSHNYSLRHKLNFAKVLPILCQTLQLAFLENIYYYSVKKSGTSYFCNSDFGSSTYDNSTNSTISESSLVCSAWAGDANIVRYLIKNNVDVNSRNNVGMTAAYAASEKGHFDILKFLVNNKADVNVNASFNGRTPLHVAAMKGHLDLVMYQVENKADVNAMDNNGHLACKIALKNGNSCIARFQDNLHMKNSHKEYIPSEVTEE